jgi:hypothetical protein
MWLKIHGFQRCERAAATSGAISAGRHSLSATLQATHWHDLLIKSCVKHSRARLKSLAARSSSGPPTKRYETSIIKVASQLPAGKLNSLLQISINKSSASELFGRWIKAIQGWQKLWLGLNTCYYNTSLTQHLKYTANSMWCLADAETEACSPVTLRYTEVRKICQYLGPCPWGPK